ncbi:MAG: GNAT family N-acetyltransferase [Hyphomonadaceae bacterium]
MTTRNLSALFTPRVIALIGASNQPGSVGAVLARNLFAGGFDGPIMPVNPHEAEIQSVACYRSVSDLPATPDLAVIATPAATIPGLIAELGNRGCRAAVIITAGLDPHSKAATLAAARPHLLRVIGPNCLGFQSPARGINASFAHLAPDPGDIAFVTQSGAIATSIIDWARGRGVGFSHLLSLGDMSDVDFGDLLDFLARDAATRSILLYAETITQARKFMSAGRIAARAKPVIVVKGGRSVSGARAASSHTGALAGADIVYDAAFRRAGMLRVETLRDLFDAAETLASGWRPRGDRLLIITNGGGLGVLAADALEKEGGSLAVLSEASIAKLDVVMPKSWSRGNPVDILGDAPGQRYGSALEAVAADAGWDAALLMNCPTGVADNAEAAEAVLAARKKDSERPWLGCWMGDATAEAPRKLLSRAGLPNFETPDEAVRAFMQLVEHARNQALLLQAPARSTPPPEGAKAAVRAILDAVIAAGRTTLTEPEAKQVLAEYGIPVVRTIFAATPQEAGLAADAIGGAVVLKILSRQITHKTDVGGVRLSLEGAAAVTTAAQAMVETVRKLAPEAEIDGFTVQAMVKRPLAQELILGAVDDLTFGPCLLFGHGGIATEVIGDRVMGLPPLNGNLARDMIARTRVARLLAGFRNRPMADLNAVAATLVALSDLVIDCPEIAELDINPLLADADGVIALDARVIVRPAPENAPARLSICAYPEELTHRLLIGDQDFLIRAIRPDDSAALVDMMHHTNPDDLRLRFHGSIGATPDRLAARLSQIDYDREMALVAIEPGGNFAGVSRLIFEPDFSAAELAILVRSDLQGEGLGRVLLSEILAHARENGASRAWGDVMRGNARFLSLARELGATQTPSPDDPKITRVEFNLGPAR